METCSPFFRLCAQGNPSSRIDRQPMATRTDSAAARYADGPLQTWRGLALPDPSRHRNLPRRCNIREGKTMHATPRPTLFGAAWHALTAVGMFLLVALL